jgi:trk system potassium uptake protein TrkH
LSKEIERSTFVYFILWVMIVAIGTLLLCLDVNAGQDIFTNFTATLTCIGNVGPGMTSVIGPLGNFAAYNGFSKILLSIIMLAGRLEILPMLILFAPNTWKRGK